MARSYVGQVCIKQVVMNEWGRNEGAEGETGRKEEVSVLSEDNPDCEEQVKRDGKDSNQYDKEDVN
ncbi:hypothetical protein ACTXT7_008367 [Hymenolepis weldensis]